MRCVNEIFPPRPRARWLLMTMRLSMSSFAGTARTLVAVGTSSEASMLVTTRAAGPRSGVTDEPPAFAGPALGRGGWFGVVESSRAADGFADGTGADGTTGATGVVEVGVSARGDGSTGRVATGCGAGADGAGATGAVVVAVGALAVGA